MKLVVFFLQLQVLDIVTCYMCNHWGASCCILEATVSFPGYLSCLSHRITVTISYFQHSPSGSIRSHLVDLCCYSWRTSRGPACTFSICNDFLMAKFSISNIFLLKIPRKFPVSSLNSNGYTKLSSTEYCDISNHEISWDWRSTIVGVPEPSPQSHMAWLRKL